MTKDNQSGKLYLRADKNVPYGLVVRIMSALKTGGIANLGISQSLKRNPRRDDDTISAKIAGLGQPEMMALSLLLHGIAILALIIFAYYRPVFRNQARRVSAGLEIVESIATPPVKAEKLRAATSNQKEIPAAVENTRSISEDSRQKVTMRTLTGGS